MPSTTSDIPGGLDPSSRRTNFDKHEMSFDFLGLSPEVRDRIYEHSLIQQKPIRLFDRGQELTIGLLRVNKLVHREASALLYTRNHFNLYTGPDAGEAVAEFLTKIGQENAGYIRHVRMRFPWVVPFGSAIQNLTPESFRIQDGSGSPFTTIKRACTKLRSLTTSRSSIRKFEFYLTLLPNPKMAGMVIKLFNTKIRAIPSLEEFIVEVNESRMNIHARKQMEACEWRMKTPNPNDGRNDKPNKMDIDWGSQTRWLEWNEELVVLDTTSSC